MKKVIALRGRSNSGKSSTIREVFAIVRERHPGSIVRYITRSRRLDGKDLHLIVVIGGFLIGIESQRDPGTRPCRLEKSRAYFKEEGCDLILCTARGRGYTVDVVDALRADGYAIRWRDQPTERPPDSYEASNRQQGGGDR
jgi:hypothetical protein